MKFVVISDTHFKNEEEAILPFQYLINLINEINPDFVIHCGDGIHSTELKADDVYYYRDFLLQIKAPIYHLMGNHDWGSEKIPNLVAILSHLDKIKIIDKPEIIKKEDLSLCFIPYPSPRKMAKLEPKAVPSLLEKEAEKLFENSKKPNILFLHWIIQGSIAESDYKFIEYEASFPINFDYIIAGHIHIFQTFRNVIIPGAIYPLRFSKNLFFPKILLFSYPPLNYETIDLPCFKQKLIIEINKREDLNKLEKYLSKDYAIRIKLLDKSLAPSLSLALKQFQKKEISIIEAYEEEIKLKTNFYEIIKESEYDEKTKQKLISLYDFYSKDLPNLFLPYIPLSITATNYKQFSHLEFNYNQFGKINTIIGENASGKTNFLDLESFALYKTTNKKEDLSDVIKIGTKECEIVFNFLLADKEYRLTRIIGDKNRSILEVKEDGKFKVLYTQEKKINDFIKERINPYIFELTYSAQDEIAKLVSLRQAELKEFLISLLGLKNYQILYEKANEKKISLERRKEELEKIIKELKSLIPEEIEDEKELERKRDELEKERERLLQLQREYEENELKKKRIRDLERLISEVDEERINQLEKEISSIRNRLKELDIERWQKEKEKREKELSIITSKIITLKEKLKMIDAKASILKKVDCTRRDCPFLKDAFLAIDEKKKVEESLKELEIKREELDNELKEIEQNFNLKEYAQLQKRLSELNSELTILKQTKAKNERLQKEILSLRSEIKEIEKPPREKIDNLLTEIMLLNTRIEEIRQKKKIKERLEEKEREYNEVSEEYRIYEIFTTLTHRDGIPLRILEMAIPRVQFYTNQMLSFFDLSVKINKIDDEIIINFIDDKGEHPLKAASGFQKNIIGLALRLALANVLTDLYGIKIHKLTIDEGIGAFSLENQRKLAEFFSSTQFLIEKIVLATHTSLRIGNIFEIRDGKIV